MIDESVDINIVEARQEFGKTVYAGYIPERSRICQWKHREKPESANQSLIKWKSQTKANDLVWDETRRDTKNHEGEARINLDREKERNEVPSQRQNAHLNNPSPFPKAKATS